MDVPPETSTGAKPNRYPIVQYIEQNKWKKVIKLLTSKDGVNILTKRNLSGLSMLGFAVSHKPPVNVVEIMLKMNPSLIHQADSNGHLPLHIACASGCSSDLINILIQEDGGAAVSMAAMINQRFPLHYTCLYILNPQWYENMKDFSDENMQSEKEPFTSGSYHKKNIIRRTRSHQEDFSLKSKESRSKPSNHDSFSESTIMTLKYEEFEDQLLVLQRLLSVAPQVVNAKDKYGYAPIDYFQDFLAENMEVSPRWERCDIVSDILRSASIKFYKMMKKTYENQGNNRPDSENVPSNGDGRLESDCIWGALSELEIDRACFNHMDTNSPQGSLHISIEQNQQTQCNILSAENEELEKYAMSLKRTQN